jgi:hypothetical protein
LDLADLCALKNNGPSTIPLAHRGRVSIKVFTVTASAQ